MSDVHDLCRTSGPGRKENAGNGNTRAVAVTFQFFRRGIVVGVLDDRQAADRLSRPHGAASSRLRSCSPSEENWSLGAVAPPEGAVRHRGPRPDGSKILRMTLPFDFFVSINVW